MNRAVLEKVRCVGSKRWIPGASGVHVCPDCGKTVAVTLVSELRVHHVGTQERPVRAVATRKARLPRLLRDMAQASGKAPTEFLISIIESHETNEDAARSIGVNRNTLWRWCRRLGIAVAREAQP